MKKTKIMKIKTKTKKEKEHKTDGTHSKKDLIEDYQEIISNLVAAKELAAGKISECGYKYIENALNEVCRDMDFLISITNEKRSQNKLRNK